MGKDNLIIAFAARKIVGDYNSLGLDAAIVRSFITDGVDRMNREKVCYLAVRTQNLKGRAIVSCAIVSVFVSPDENILTVNTACGESDASDYTDCPPTILEVLTEPETEESAIWRKRCASKRWSYQMCITTDARGFRNINVLLSCNGCTRLVHAERNICPEAFRDTYYRIASEFVMSSIPAL